MNYNNLRNKNLDNFGTYLLFINVAVIAAAVWMIIRADSFFKELQDKGVLAANQGTEQAYLPWILTGTVCLLLLFDLFYLKKRASWQEKSAKLLLSPSVPEQDKIRAGIARSRARFLALAEPFVVLLLGLLVGILTFFILRPMFELMKNSPSL